MTSAKKDKVYKLPLKAQNTNCHFHNNIHNHAVLKIVALHSLPDFDRLQHCTVYVKIVCFTFRS